MFFSYCLKEYKLVDQDFKPFWVPCSWLPQVDAAQGLSLEQQLSYYDVAKERLRSVSLLQPVGLRIYNKFLESEARNPGLEDMYKIRKMHQKSMVAAPLPPTAQEDIPLLRYCPLTSVECERSFRLGQDCGEDCFWSIMHFLLCHWTFPTKLTPLYLPCSIYKDFLSPKRRCFTKENIRRHQVIHFWDGDNYACCHWFHHISNSANYFFQVPKLKCQWRQKQAY